MGERTIRGGVSGVALALVLVGGAAGSLARYAVGLALPDAAELATLLVNLAGAFVLGWLAGWLRGARPRTYLLLGTGFCGGFTTYSTFAVGVLGLMLSGSLLHALLLALATVVGGLIATVAGLALGERMPGRGAGPSTVGGANTDVGNADVGGAA